MVNVSFTEYEADVVIASLIKVLDDTEYADSDKAVRMRKAMLNAVKKTYSSLNETALAKAEKPSVRKCEAVKGIANGKVKKILRKMDTFYIFVD